MTIKTSQDYLHMYKVLDVLEKSSYSTSSLPQNTLGSLQKFLDVETFDKLESLYEAGDYSAFSSAISAQKKILQQMVPVHVSFAETPQPAQLDDLYAILVSKWGTRLYIDIKISPEILGGVVLDLNGKYHDFSLLAWFRRQYEI